jgi:hypothetical protein
MIEQRIALQALGEIGDGLIIDLIRSDPIRRALSERAAEACSLVAVADALVQGKPGRRQSYDAPPTHNFRAGEFKGGREQSPNVPPSGSRHSRPGVSHETEPAPQRIRMRRNISQESAEQSRDLADRGHEVVPVVARQMVHGGDAVEHLSEGRRRR